MNRNFTDLLSLVPKHSEEIKWDKIQSSELQPHFKKMSETPQNPEWHGEGDVLTHTKMVCESLIKIKSWQKLERRKQEELFIAALLHDIGKPSCTRKEDGSLVSPSHTSIGDRMARVLLWRDLGMSGTEEAQRFRETVCALVRHHSKPFRFMNGKAPERSVIELSSIGAPVPDFSNELLSILAEADIKGRIAADTDSRLEDVSCFREMSAECNCLNQPFTFSSAFSRYAYLSGRNLVPGQDLYDDTWGTVIILSGLPGTGKDTYIKKAYPDLPVVSLDALRNEMNIPPVGPQHKVVEAAREQAKGYLRNKQPFVWNATNVTPVLREKQIKMFMDYKAAVKIVFLETRLDDALRRNKGRKEAVPESVIMGMLDKLVPPNLCEAHEVEWILV